MKKKWTHNFNYDPDIALQKLTGPVDVNDLIDCWSNLIKEMESNSLKGVVNDLRDATIAMNISDISKIIKLFNDHNSIFEKLKIAVVTDNPKTIVFPTIASVNNPQYKIKAFTTIEASKDWILHGS